MVSVVEDDAEVRELAVEILISLGYRPLEVVWLPFATPTNKVNRYPDCRIRDSVSEDTTGSGSDLPLNPILAMLPVAASGHLGNLGS
jgi:hypothetical protein